MQFGSAKGYTFHIERGDVNYSEIEPLYRQHYGEMRDRLARDGVNISPYNPQLDRYFSAFKGGWLINYVVRKDGAAVGYSNVYLTPDMHNGDLIGSEDTIYITPEHRCGVGRDLVKSIMDDLRRRGAKRVYISPVTDLRVGKIWRRMGFKDVANHMIYTFEG